MRTIVIKNNTNAPQHIRGLRASDGGQETTFHVMPKARATLKADTFFGLNALPKDVVVVSDTGAASKTDDYARRKAAANAKAASPEATRDVSKDVSKDQQRGHQPKGNDRNAETK